MDFQLLAKGIALAGCAIGAGCALIAGIGPGIGEGKQRHWKQSDVSLSARVMLLLPCFLDVPLQRQQVSTVS